MSKTQRDLLKIHKKKLRDEELYYHDRPIHSPKIEKSKRKYSRKRYKNTDTLTDEL